MGDGTAFDVGVDARFLNNRLTFGMVSTTRIPSTRILTLTPPLATGTTEHGEEHRQGEQPRLRVRLGWQDQVGEFTYGVNANLATISSEVKEMEGARIVNDLSDFVYFDKGQPMWSYYGYKYLGVNPEDGSAIYYDKDKSGTIDDKDKVYLGSAIPDFTYGITLNAAYKGFDLTVFGSGSHGGLLSLYGARLTPSATSPPNCGRIRGT